MCSHIKSLFKNRISVGLEVVMVLLHNQMNQSIGWQMQMTQSPTTIQSQVRTLRHTKSPGGQELIFFYR